MMRPLFLLAAWTISSAHLFGQDVKPAPVPDGKALLALLRQDEEAETFPDRLRCTKAAMEALLAADKETLFAAFDAGLAEKWHYGSRWTMLVERCALKDPDAAIRRWEAIADGSLSCDVGCDVWSMIARNDPDRAVAVVQQLYDPKNQFNRATLLMDFYSHRLTGSIMSEVGSAWWKRDRLATLKKLGSLPHADDLDDGLFRGMCEAARTTEDRLALLDWFVGPQGRRLQRFEKGHSSWYERMTQQAARDDLAKTRAWVEKHFPPGRARKSDFEADWDIVHVRHALFEAWAETDPLPAADWLMAQYSPDDKDGQWAMQLCFDALRVHPKGGWGPAADWLTARQELPGFIEVARGAMHQASRREEPSCKSLETFCARLASLPFETRLRIVAPTLPKDDPLDSRGGDSPARDPRVLPALFPVESERQRAEAKLDKALRKPEGEAESASEKPPADDWWNTFKLEHRAPTPPARPEDRERARTLAADHEAWRTSLDPEARLKGLAALDWLAHAGNAERAALLPAHLENTRGVMDGFASDWIDAWADADWQACEKFAWEAALPASTRESILIGTFSRAALSHPDEIYVRLTTLVAEGRMRADALAPQLPMQTGPGWFWFPRRIATNLGSGWAIRNGAGCVEKIQAMPADWQEEAIKGASDAFLKAEVGLALLEWIAKQDKAEPKAKKDSSRCTGLCWNHWLQASPILSHLASIDVAAAQKWLEADPARLAQLENPFDGFDYFFHELLSRDPLAAAEWARRVRPDFDVTWHLVSALADQDEAKAVAWIEAHPEDPHLDEALLVMADRWEIGKPAEAAKLVARLKDPKRQADHAAELAFTWKRLDEKAARLFLDQTFGKSSKQRRAVEAEITRLEECSRDRPKR